MTVSAKALHYSDYTTEQITSLLKSTRLLLPVGTIEQHGPHLPLSVDIDIPQAIVEELSKRGFGVAAPPLIYGARSQPHSGGGSSFAGTIHVKGTTLISYYTDIIKSFVSAGAYDIFVINGHYENEPFLFEAFEICRENHQLDEVRLMALSWWSILDDKTIHDVLDGDFPGWHAEHAGIVETSLMMYLKPHLVNDIRVDHQSPPLAGVYLHPIDADSITTRGVLTKTSAANANMGKFLFEYICEKLETLIRNPHGLKKL